MAQLVWSPSALAGLAEICEYISRDSEYYAKLFAQRIFSAAEKLTLFPEAGRVVPEYDRSDLRELLFQNYRIVYRIKGKQVQIAAVVHGARLLPEIWEEGEPPVTRDLPAQQQAGRPAAKPRRPRARKR
ncbi:type II toxin-antitoxin system RelE/ParE family toxin [candidate division WOR-3 bacterium]|uniref:Type II toxin-antitoxin system RelE/ParE family toxin n=1 Tax=candidate division WOR-3 bacterium TaxID=2052148 RepID=A0A938BVA1_UNCW3|nr:type II toxin-antitoxin system RelE/ParE family toxin [candidate division WOR-3 bacterium]